MNGEFEVDSNSFELQGGTLAGSGTAINNGWVDSNLTNTGGVISPGATAASGIGLLTIEGTLSQSGNGEDSHRDCRTQLRATRQGRGDRRRLAGRTPAV